MKARTSAPLFATAVIAVAVTALTSAQAPAPLPSDDLFNPVVVQTIELRLHTADWEKLKQNFQENQYYPADLVWNGHTILNNGIRSRGLGSRSGTKPGLRVDFNYNVTDQTFVGLKSLILDNLLQDASGVHETVAMRVFARLGIPAPREAHARLYVNGRYVGLYAVIESIDKDFLARVFGSIDDDVQNDGYLYEFEWLDPWRLTYLGSDLDAYKARFQAKTHEKKSVHELYSPIENLVRLANELPASQLMSSLDQHIDLRAFIRYVAAQNFVAQDDGFLGYAGMNNFYFYRLENSSRHVFIAWDEDMAFWGPEYAVDMRHDENVLMRKAMEVPELNDLYYSTLSDAMNFSEQPTGPDGLPWLEHEIRRQTDMIHSALRDDPVKPYTIEQHDGARAAMIQFAQNRPRFVRDQLRTNRLRQSRR